MNTKENYEEVYTREFFRAVTKSCKLAHERISSFWLYPDFIHKFSTHYAEVQQSSKILYDSANKVLLSRRRDFENNDKLQMSTDSNKVQAMKVSIFDGIIKSKLNDQEIREEIFILIGATELSGISIGFTLMLLGLYPAVQDEVFEEIRKVFRDTERPIEKNDLDQLNYLDMVIKESLRLYPPAPFITRKAHKDITLPSGRIIPEDAEVLVSIIGLHRSSKYWGPDVDHFDPNRFLPDRFRKVHPHAYLPFSYGLRKCIGYRYGLTTMKIGIVAILRKYKIVGKPAKGPIPNIRQKFELFLKPVNNFEIEIVRRN